MAGENNLIPMSERSKDEARELGRKGGENSGKARRERKKMREQAELLLSLPLKNEKLRAQIEALGVDADEIDNQMAMTIAMWQNVLKGGKGSVQAFNSLRDLVGEKPKEVVELHNTDETVNKLDEIIKQRKDD